jgi:hypothetical protein
MSEQLERYLVDNNVIVAGEALPRHRPDPQLLWESSATSGRTGARVRWHGW